MELLEPLAAHLMPGRRCGGSDGGVDADVGGLAVGRLGVGGAGAGGEQQVATSLNASRRARTEEQITVPAARLQ